MGITSKVQNKSKKKVLGIQSPFVINYAKQSNLKEHKKIELEKKIRKLTFPYFTMLFGHSKEFFSVLSHNMRHVLEDTA